GIGAGRNGRRADGRTPGDRVLARRVDEGEKLCALRLQPRARLFHAFRRDLQVEILRERGIDQLLEGRVMEEILPLRIRDGRVSRWTRRSAAKLGGQGNVRLLVIRPDRAACEEQNNGSQPQEPHPVTSGTGAPPGAVFFRLAKLSITTKSTGTIKTANRVEASIPPNTAVPRARRAPELAPVAMTSGSTPRMNANDVIRIGRSRRLAASMTASRMERPCSTRSRANSTIRIAFFAERPISVTMPICV